MLASRSDISLNVRNEFSLKLNNFFLSLRKLQQRHHCSSPAEVTNFSNSAPFQRSCASSSTNPEFPLAWTQLSCGLRTATSRSWGRRWGLKSHVNWFSAIKKVGHEKTCGWLYFCSLFTCRPIFIRKNDRSRSESHVLLWGQRPRRLNKVLRGRRIGLSVGRIVCTALSKNDSEGPIVPGGGQSTGPDGWSLIARCRNRAGSPAGIILCLRMARTHM